MKKSVLAVGFDLPNVEGFETVQFTDGRSLLDADVIAIELSLQEFSNGMEGYAGASLLSDYSSASFRSILEHWPAQIASAAKHGKTVLFFLTQRDDRYYYTGQKNVSGTGRSTRVNNIVEKCSNYDFLPIKLTNEVFGRGHAMVLGAGADVIGRFWRDFGNMLFYNCTFQADGFQPLILTKTGSHVVGAIRRLKGALLLLPELSWENLPIYKHDDDGVELDEWSDEMIKFTYRLRDSLLSINESLAGDVEDATPPAWLQTPRFRTKAEADLEHEIATLEQRIAELAEQKAKLISDMREAGWMRSLLFAKGRDLEQGVRIALNTLGFDAQNFKYNGSEFDALFTSEEGRFLGEVEGKDTKPVNVDKISQLQRNLTEDLARDEVSAMAIGVLFGNAFRLLSPEERGEFFTDKVIQVSKIAKIALVRTTDLFHVIKYLSEADDSEFALKCRVSIATQVGGIVEFPAIPQNASS